MKMKTMFPWEPIATGFYHVDAYKGGRLQRTLVVAADSDIDAIQKVKAAGYQYAGTSVYQVSEWYIEHFEPFYTMLAKSAS